MDAQEKDMKEIVSRCGMIKELAKGTKYGSKSDADAIIYHSGVIQDLAIKMSVAAERENEHA